MSIKQVYRNQKISRLVIAGLVGTLVFYIAAFIDMEITWISLDISVVLGQLVAGEDESAIIIGNIFHITNGICLTLFFGYVFMPISRKILNSRIWLHGNIFGVIVTATTVWFRMLPALGSGVAGLNIAPEVPAMTMSRHIVFGAVIGVLSKSLYEERKWLN